MSVVAASGISPRSIAHSDALFELASVIVATAMRLMHAAAKACEDSATGVPTSAAVRAHKLLLQAAGMLEFVAASVAPLLSAEPPSGADLHVDVLRAVSSIALADAQQLTMLRAMAKGNAPGLIAALAVDTAALYQQACSQVGQCFCACCLPWPVKCAIGICADLTTVLLAAGGVWRRRCRQQQALSLWAVQACALLLGLAEAIATHVL
jgi:hypothetical protein